MNAEEKKYIPIEKILKHNKSINIIATATGTRKTTYFAEWAKERVAEGKIVVWVRRRKEDVTSGDVVDLFRRVFADDHRFSYPYITSQGVKAEGYGNGGKCIYFIPLSTYYKFKGITKIDELLAGIVYDEAIPMDKEWIGNDPSAEERSFANLVNIIIRPGQKAPVYFLCNPNTLGSWLIQKWFPDFRPNPKKEKLEINKKDDALIYTMPWMGGDRGSVERFESEEQKQVSKFGVFKEKEYTQLTNEKPGKHICSLIIGSKEIELSQKGTKFIMSEPVKRNKKNVICFKRMNLINSPGSILGNRRYYAKWITNLWAQNKLWFTNPVIKTYLESNLDREHFW